MDSQSDWLCHVSVHWDVRACRNVLTQLPLASQPVLCFQRLGY